MADTRLLAIVYESAGMSGSEMSKTVNRPVLRVGLVVTMMYCPSEVVTGVPTAFPEMGEVANISDPSAELSAITVVLHWIGIGIGIGIGKIQWRSEQYVMFDVRCIHGRLATHLAPPDTAE